MLIDTFPYNKEITMIKRIKNILASKEFKQARNEAEGHRDNTEKTEKLVDEAAKKFQRKKQSQFGQAWEYLAALIRMVQAYIRREYTQVPWESIALSITAIIYFVSPIDLIPDFLLSLAYIDDAAVIAFVIRAIRKDLEDFLRWEAERNV
ncbi:MAG: DUF1232 domain-containing protein [wastewater metagenome]|nr:DUF1232 domain-containing protein [Candidatus Loosdrechtia aerotolerans]